MTLAATDVVPRLSTGSTGTRGNTSASTPAASLGKYVSTTAWSASVFDIITAAENAASTTDYRCIFVVNISASDTAGAVKVWLGQVAGGASVVIALDPRAASAVDSTTAQAAVTTSGTVAPSGVTGWAAPTTADTGLLVGTLGPGQCRALWIKRTAANTSAMTGDGFSLTFRSEAV